MSIEAMKQALEAHKKNERHRTVAETRYWCDQYRLLSEQAIAAIEAAEKQDVEQSSTESKETFDQPVGWMDGNQVAGLILSDPDGGEMRVSSDLTIEHDGAMRFTVTNPKTGRRFGIYLGITELSIEAKLKQKNGCAEEKNT
jgi:hypothetical protein